MVNRGSARSGPSHEQWYAAAGAAAGEASIGGVAEPTPGRAGAA